MDTTWWFYFLQTLASLHWDVYYRIAMLNNSELNKLCILMYVSTNCQQRTKEETFFLNVYNSVQLSKLIFTLIRCLQTTLRAHNYIQGTSITLNKWTSVNTCLIRIYEKSCNKYSYRRKVAYSE